MAAVGKTAREALSRPSSCFDAGQLELMRELQAGHENRLRTIRAADTVGYGLCVVTTRPFDWAASFATEGRAMPRLTDAAALPWELRQATDADADPEQRPFEDAHVEAFDPLVVVNYDLRLSEAALAAVRGVVAARLLSRRSSVVAYANDAAEDVSAALRRLQTDFRYWAINLIMDVA